MTVSITSVSKPLRVGGIDWANLPPRSSRACPWSPTRAGPPPSRVRSTGLPDNSHSWPRGRSPAATEPPRRPQVGTVNANPRPRPRVHRGPIRLCRQHRRCRESSSLDGDASRFDFSKRTFLSLVCSSFPPMPIGDKAKVSFCGWALSGDPSKESELFNLLQLWLLSRLSCGNIMSQRLPFWPPLYAPSVASARC
jgi:hypothetical protein